MADARDRAFTAPGGRLGEGTATGKLRASFDHLLEAQFQHAVALHGAWMRIGQIGDGEPAWCVYLSLALPYITSVNPRRRGENMTESEIWQIIQTGNEISVMRTEVFVTVTVGVLIMSTLNAIKLSKALLVILLGTYLVFGYINFAMLVAEMEILLNGMRQLASMANEGEAISLMGSVLVQRLDTPTATLLIPALHVAFWTVSLGTVSYTVWQYAKQDGAD